MFWKLTGLTIIHMIPLSLIWVAAHSSMAASVATGGLLVVVVLDLTVLWLSVSEPKVPVVRVAPPWPHCNGRPDRHDCIDVAGCPVWVIRE
jgi:hypothetical protein